MLINGEPGEEDKVLNKGFCYVGSSIKRYEQVKCGLSNLSKHFSRGQNH